MNELSPRGLTVARLSQIRFQKLWVEVKGLKLLLFNSLDEGQTKFDNYIYSCRDSVFWLHYVKLEKVMIGKWRQKV